MNKSPSATVKEQFGDKAKLVAALGPFTNDDLWVKRVNETKGLERVSNAKLLKLFNVLTVVKDKFGTRSKLVDAICEVEKRAKDEGYKKRLLAYPVPRLYDLYTLRRAPRRRCSSRHRSRGSRGQGRSGLQRIQGKARGESCPSQEARCRERKSRARKEEGLKRVPQNLGDLGGLAASEKRLGVFLFEVAP